MRGDLSPTPAFRGIQCASCDSSWYLSSSMEQCVNFFFVDRFLRTSNPVAFTNAADLFSSARSPYSFSLRGLFSGQVSPLRQTCRGQCWSKCSVAFRAVSQGHVSHRPVFNLWERWAFRLLCPVRSLNRMTCSDLIRQYSSCLTCGSFGCC